jgi:hypothetical protein
MHRHSRYPRLDVCRRNRPRRSPSPGTVRGAVLVILAAVALVAVPVAVVEWPREVARWHLASAAEQALNGDYAAAVTRMDRAIAWDDQEPALYLERAQYKLEAGQWQSGLDDCDLARRWVPADTRVGELRSQILQHLGRHSEAVAEWREIMRAGGVLCRSCGPTS